ASMVLFGTFQNAKLDPNGDLGGSTDLVVEAVVKSHDILNGKKTLTLPRYIASDPKNPVKYLVFCDVYKGKIDPYRGLALPLNYDMVKYLKGALELDAQKKTVGERLRYFFNYLDNPDADINGDAFREFSNVDYKDYQAMAAKLPPETIVKWLE